MDSTNTPRRSPRIAEQQAKMSSNTCVAPSARVAPSAPRVAPSAPRVAPSAPRRSAPRRSPRIAEKNRLAEIKQRMANYKPPARVRVNRIRVPVKVDYYNCWFDKNTGTWISEKDDYESDC